MKKIILISSFAVFIIAACKKDRTCTCTNTPTSYTWNGQTQKLDPPTTTVNKLTKVAKDAADCSSGEETFKTTYSIPASPGFPGTVIAVAQTNKIDCKLD